MSESSYRNERPRVTHTVSAVDGRSILGFVLGVLALCSILFPPLSILSAAAAIVLAVSSRRRLALNPELRGARLGAAAVVFAAIALLLTAVPAMLSLGMVASAPRF